MSFVRLSRAEHGQATVELVALLPLMAVLAGILWQVVIAGQTVWLSGSAARAAARAGAVGADPGAAARRVLPPRLERGLVVRRMPSGGGVRVAIGVPAIVGRGRLATVSARARLQEQAG
ncbi:MAG TPA: hypothetical protein VNT54_12645 [Solirubrobacteraceae bacterium]|nr:hypothetical protein [Solirubrobacteraceae bacterium]